MLNMLKKGYLLLLILTLALSGCAKGPQRLDHSPKIYYFDSTKGELVAESLDEEFTILTNKSEQVEYIISKLKANKSSQKNTLQANNQMPIKGATTNANIVRINFSEQYLSLPSQDRIGIRSAIVYSLTKLDFIDGVDFYVEDKPLTTSTGQTVGVISQGNIKTNVLEPKPATTPYNLKLYFVNQEGKLEKEERGILVSDPTSVEKLLLEELIKGPKSESLSPVLPSGTKVNEVTTNNGVCQIDLSFDMNSSFFTSAEDKERMIYAIVNSLTEISQIKKVAFLIDGKNDIGLTENIDLRDTFERSEVYIEK